MNLHAAVRGMITAVNPDVLGTVRRNAGIYTKTADHRQVPAYLADVTGVPMQVQPLSTRDLKTLAALNITEIEQAVYVNGELTGVDRKAGKGGDLIFFNGVWWLVVAVLEPWAPTAGWTKVGVVKQMDPTP